MLLVKGFVDHLFKTRCFGALLVLVLQSNNLKTGGKNTTTPMLNFSICKRLTEKVILNKVLF